MNVILGTMERNQRLALRSIVTIKIFTLEQKKGTSSTQTA